MIRALFAQLSEPGRLRPLDLVEVLDWTEAALNRVEQGAFFARFQEAEAVEYFYEPFLEAFDPELRKQLGVWYTPPEVVTYMVERIDRSLRDDLLVEDGLAAENVYVLDPCCGTGSFLAAVLRRISATLEQRGYGALVGQLVKKAAVERVFGFELLPAPFVVAHLQVGLRLQALDVPLSDDTGERAAIYLTNALTGWEPERDRPALPFPELAEERERAEGVKREKPILVILGNPPYNGYAGVNYSAEELALTEPYRRVRKVRPPEGQGLNDLYVRFFRMAERRIVERTGRGIVCFISNYSWLDGLSFTGMRERFLEAFDVLRIDCLNGDKYKTGKVTPAGRPDPSIFSTEHNREGIQVGTAIALLIRKTKHQPAASIGFRHLWGIGKRQELLDTAPERPEKLYPQHAPPMGLGLPFLPDLTAEGYLQWPKLPELFPTSFPGVKTSRDEFLVDIDRERLEARLRLYFDPSVSHEQMRRIAPSVMEPAARFAPEQVRDVLRARGPLFANVVQYHYRPFDVRWLYWEPETKLLDEKRSEYWPHAFEGNLWIEAREKQTKELFSRGGVNRYLADNFGNGLSHYFPLYAHDPHAQSDENGIPKRPNLTRSVAEKLASSGFSPEDLFYHVVAVLHAPAYRAENAGSLRMDWPRVPFPVPAKAMRRSADLGRRLAALLDPEAPVPGVTAGALRPELALAQPRREGGGPLRDDDLKLAAGWGYRGQGGAVMPGQGLVRAREYTESEAGPLAARASGLRLAPSDMLALLGSTTCDVHLNVEAYWANIPANVWSYTLGGYQVLKKWLSYRDERVLGRRLKPEEVAYMSAMARRIAAILLLGPALDENYAALKIAAPASVAS